MRERAFLVVATLVLLILAWTVQPTGTDYRKTIVDVSWPQCEMEAKDRFGVGIVGVTGGLDFHPNPCAGEEAGWFSHYAIYINTGYPGRTRGQKFKSTPKHCGAKQDLCLAYNYGFNAALYAIRQANLQNVHASLWWLDVETENSWTDNFLANRRFLQGAAAATRQNIWFAKVGIYSSQYQWNALMGPWQTHQPVWWATGATNKDDAAKFCRRKAFTGGKVWLSQYTIKFDENVSCAKDFINNVTNVPSRFLPKLKV